MIGIVWYSNTLIIILYYMIIATDIISMCTYWCKTRQNQESLTRSRAEVFAPEMQQGNKLQAVQLQPKENRLQLLSSNSWPFMAPIHTNTI